MMEDIKPLVTKNKKFQYPDEKLYKALFGKSEDQYFNGGTKSTRLPSRPFSQLKRVSLRL